MQPRAVTVIQHKDVLFTANDYANLNLQTLNMYKFGTHQGKISENAPYLCTMVALQRLF